MDQVFEVGLDDREFQKIAERLPTSLAKAGAKMVSAYEDSIRRINAVSQTWTTANQQHAQMVAAAHAASADKIAEAYKHLGVQTDRELAKTRDAAVGAFNTIKNSGTASAAEIARASKALEKELGQNLPNAVGRTEASLKTLGLTAATVGATLTLVARQAVSDFEKFETSIARAVGAAGGGKADMDAFAKAAKDLATELGRGGVTAQGTADALYAIAQAGYKGQQALDVLRPSIVLAAAAQQDFGRTSEGVIAVMQQFGLRTNEAARVANVLAAANQNALGSVTLFTEGLRIVGPTAAEMGESLETVSGALAILLNTGMDASTAGTSLRQMFLQLASPTNEAREALGAYGIKLRDVNPATKSFAEIVDLLAKKQVDAGTAAKVFGDRTATAYMILAKAGKQGMDDMQRALTGTNSAWDQFQVQISRSTGTLSEMRSALERVSIELGERLVKSIQGPVSTLTDLIKSFNELPEPVKQGAAQLLAFSIAVAAIATAAAGVIAIAPQLVIALRSIASATPAGLVATLGLMAALEAMKQFNDATAEGGDRLVVLRQRAEELEKVIAAAEAKPKRGFGLFQPSAEIDRMKGQLASVREEIAKLEGPMRSTAAAQQLMTNTMQEWEVQADRSTKAKAGTVLDTEAQGKMREGLTDLTAKLGELRDAAARATLLPEEAEIASRVDPIIRQLAKIREEMVRLEASDKTLAMFDKRAAAMRSEATAYARSEQATKRYAATQAEAAKVVADMEEELSGVHDLLKDAKLWNDLAVALDKIREEMSGNEIARFNKELHETEQALKKALAGGADAAGKSVELLTTRIRNLHSAISFVQSAKRFDDSFGVLAESVSDYGDKLKRISDEYRIFGDADKKLRDSIEATRAEIIRLRDEGYSPTSSKVEELSGKLAVLNERLAANDLWKKQSDAARAYRDELESIAVQAELVPGFDRLGTTLEAVERRMLEVAKATGVASAETQALKAEYDHLKDVADTRDLWRDLFGSITQGIDQVVKGLQQGTLTWKSFGDIAIQVIQSIAAELINRLAKRALEPVLDMLVNALSGGAALATGTGGGGNPFTGPTFNASDPNATFGSGSGVIGGGGGFNLLSTGISAIGSLGRMFPTLQVGIDAFNLSMNLGASTANSFIYGLDAIGATIGTFGSTVTAVAAAVGIALVAMRKDITDAGKAIVSSFYAAAAATAIGTGWTGGGMIVAAILAAVGAILDFTGIFSKGSEAWLSFPSRLGETLDKEATVLKGFGADLSKAIDLEGVAKAIDAFRHKIEDEAGVGGFYERTKGLGVFSVPGIPGATGTDHEGGLSFNFGPFIQQFQDGINEMLNTVRNTISVDFAKVARESLPEKIADAFVGGTLGKLRQEFEDLITSTTATVEEVKAFQEKLKGVGPILAGFAAAASQLGGIRAGARAALPSDFAAAVVGSVDALEQKLIEMATSGTATVEELTKVANAIQLLGQTAIAFGQQAVQIREVMAVATDVLPDDVATSVREMASRMREELLALAKSGKATADDLAKSQRTLDALTLAVSLYEDLNRQIAMMSGNLDTMMAAMQQAVRAQVSTAQRAIDQAAEALANAVDGPTFVAAAANLEKAILDKYALEKRLIEEIEATIAGLLQEFGPSMMQNAMTAVNLSLESGYAGGIQLLITTLNEVQRTSATASVQLWAAVSAFQALAGAIPSILKGLGSSLSNPQELVDALVNAAMPSLGTFTNLFERAMNAGDLRGALGILEQASAALTQLGNAAIAGVRQWFDQMRAAATERARQAMAALDRESDREREEINKTLKLKEEGWRLETKSLNERKSLLNQQLQQFRALQQAAASLGEFIRSHELGEAGALNPMDRLNLAQSYVDQAMAAYRADPTAGNLQAVQKAAQDYFAALPKVYDRPSSEYTNLFNGMLEKLKELQADAASRVTPEQEALLELQAIDKRLEEIGRETEDAREAAQEQLRKIDENRERLVRAIEETRDREIAGYKATAEQTIAGITNGMAVILGGIAAEQARLTGILIQQQEEIRKSITGGMDPLDFIAKANRDSVLLLTNLRNILHAALTGAPIPGPVEIPDNIPNAHVGADALEGGLVNVAEGERLRPAKLAPPGTLDRAAGGLGSGDTKVEVHFHFAPGAIVAQDPEVMWRFIEGKTEDSLKRGAMREIIRKRIVPEVARA
jgi:TP901 family phage tail tape measure protein